MKLRKIENLNAKRVEMNAKGFITKSELKDYIGCGTKKADRVWNDIVSEIVMEGKMVSPVGIEPKRVMNYLHLTEAQIEKYAASGY